MPNAMIRNMTNREFRAYKCGQQIGQNKEDKKVICAKELQEYIARFDNGNSWSAEISTSAWLAAELAMLVEE